MFRSYHASIMAAFQNVGYHNQAISVFVILCTVRNVFTERKCHEWKLDLQANDNQANYTHYSHCVRTRNKTL